ncbi:hypothetical protein NED98_11190 [Sphingomonas sp. MMSM20]|uniref:hypothetical protein n=1 Tax=Sphingomonas lycopersici TaxID=2951807 RepID=UPI002238E361|nr:hypothetical protein [Sphingomonas lycopersici]MCW6530809.1 hypothetical protein [Sphingomonas lycopersici]
MPWRLVGGAFIHFVVPIYLVAVILDTLLTAPPEATPEILLRHALQFSGRFIISYLAAALLVTLAAAAIDPILRSNRARRRNRAPRSEAELSDARLTGALSQGRGLFDPEADTVLAAIRAMQWDHQDSRYQALSRDLAEVISTTAAALPGATHERRLALGAMATNAIARIEAVLRDLEAARGRHVESRAETVARYIELRYGPSDFSGSGQ